MFKRPIIILGLLVSFGALSLLHAQALYVKNTDATQESIQLDDIRKITFPSNQIKVTKKDNSETSFAITAVRYLSFTDYGSGEVVSIKPTTDQSELTLNLNSNNNFIEISYISNSTQMGSLKILNALGKEVLSLNKQFNKGQNSLRIDISNLSNGVYLSRILVANTYKSFKLVKEQ